MANLNKCPQCHSLVEKNSGCPEMRCPICNYNWCWTCGLSKNSIFHLIQLKHIETGQFCEYINSMNQRYKNLPYPIVIICVFIYLLTMPILVIFPIIIFGIPNLIKDVIHHIKYKKNSREWYMAFFILLAPFLALLAACYTIFMSFYYLLMPIIMITMLLRIFIYNCYKPKLSQNKQLDIQIENNRKRNVEWHAQKVAEAKRIQDLKE